MALSVQCMWSQHCIEDNLDLYECIYNYKCSYIFYGMYCSRYLDSSAGVSHVSLRVPGLHQLQQVHLEMELRCGCCFVFGSPCFCLFGVVFVENKMESS